MTSTLRATYEHGVLRLSRALPLPEHAPVTVTVSFDESPSAAQDDGWSELSKAALAVTWDNESDEVFNELAKA